MSDIVALNKIFEQNCQIIYVEPFISVAQQRFDELVQMTEGLDLKIQAQFRQSQSKYNPYDVESDIVVCVIEKALNIINSYNPDKRLIGLIVLDEIHYSCSADYRGALYELLATKCLESDIQIVAFSATIPDIHVFQKWLRAEVFENNVRDIKLNVKGCLLQTLKDKTSQIKFSDGSCEKYSKPTIAQLTEAIQTELRKTNSQFANI